MQRFAIVWVAALAGCTAADNAAAPREDIVAAAYPEAEAEVQAVLDDIQLAVRENDMDRLIAHHAYGPKFSDFQDGRERTGSTENEANERGFFGQATKVNRFDYVDPKISVYGDVAVATLHPDVSLEFGPETVETQRQLTLVFARTADGWKIVHEHNSPLIAAEDRMPPG